MKQIIIIIIAVLLGHYYGYNNAIMSVKEHVTEGRNKSAHYCFYDAKWSKVRVHVDKENEDFYCATYQAYDILLWELNK